MLSISHNLLASYLDLIDVMPQLLSLCNPFVDIGGGIIADLADTPLYRQKSVKKIRGFQQMPGDLDIIPGFVDRFETVGNAEQGKSPEMTSSLSGEAPLPKELSTASAYSRCDICDGMRAVVKDFRSWFNFLQ